MFFRQMARIRASTTTGRVEASPKIIVKAPVRGRGGVELEVVPIEWCQ